MTDKKIYRLADLIALPRSAYYQPQLDRSLSRERCFLCGALLVGVRVTTMSNSVTSDAEHRGGVSERSDAGVTGYQHTRLQHPQEPQDPHRCHQRINSLESPWGLSSYGVSGANLPLLVICMTTGSLMAVVPRSRRHSNFRSLAKSPR